MSVVDTFCQLVQIDSPTGSEVKLRDHLQRLLQTEELVDVLKVDHFGNLYARKNGQGQPLFFAAHLDTVEPGRGIKPQQKKGVVTSDGSTILGADNKVAVAGIIECLRLLKGNNQHRTLEIIFTLSEEIGNYGAHNFDYRLLKAEQGFCFDYTQPIGSFIVASPFYERFDLILVGKEAHASRPAEGVNVLSIFQQLLNRWPLGQLDQQTIFNIGVVNGGFVRNTVPGKLTLNGEIRSFSERKLESYKRRFGQLVRRISDQFEADYYLEWIRENSGYKLDRTFQQQTAKALRQAGLAAEAITGWGVSDANIFAEHGLQCANLSNGAEGAHTLNERVSVQALEELVRLMQRLTQLGSFATLPASD